MRFQELLEPLEPEKLEVQFGYDVIDSYNFIESAMESKVDFTQATFGKQNPFIAKIDSEILLIDYFKLNLSLSNQLAETFTNLVPVRIQSLNFIGNDITDNEFKVILSGINET